MMCGMYGVDVSDVDDAWAILHASVYVCVYIYIHIHVYMYVHVSPMYTWYGVWLMVYGVWCILYFVWYGVWYHVLFGLVHGML